MALLTDRTLAQSSAITPTTLIHIVFTGDPSQNSAGSSYKAELGQLIPIFSAASDTFVTGFTYTANTFTIFDNLGNEYSATINSVTGLTINGNLTVTGDTTLNGLTATTLSATTYLGLPLDVFVTGGTYSAGTITFTNNSGDTFPVTGITLTFTGGSGNCVTDLYIDNLHACGTEITVHNSVQSTGSTATGILSFAFGTGNTASGNYSHAEGWFTLASGIGSHSEGGIQSGLYGPYTGGTALGNGSHAEGTWTLASGDTSHAEGYLTTSTGWASHSEGSGTTSYGNYSHSEGFGTITSGESSHAEGSYTFSTGIASHSEGFNTNSIGIYSHSEGESTVSSGQSSHSEGYKTIALGDASHTEGSFTFAGYIANTPEPTNSTTGNSAHAEGYYTLAEGAYSHSEGIGAFGTKLDKPVKAIGFGSHAEGLSTIASGTASHSEGEETIAGGDFSHAEGLLTETRHQYSHTAGWGTLSTNDYQFVVGKFNEDKPAATASFIIGNGATSLSRSDLMVAGASQVSIFGTLDVSGLTRTDTFRLRTNPFNGYVLVSDGIGNGTWQPLSAVTGTSVTSVTGITTSAFTADTSYEYYGVEYTGTTNIEIPSASGLNGFTIRFKDERGTAATYPITITPVTGNIDGNPSVIMSINYMSLTLVARNNNWWII